MDDEVGNEEFDMEPDFGTGIHVITITYNDDPSILPQIDVGGCSVWAVASMLRAALDSLDILIPPVDVFSHGDPVICHSVPEDAEVMEFDDEDEDY